ncbi:SIS domain-containing protein [Rathayibacter soli]|uniref:SIS domain-containing protein n=1 Tax=Rathayibacter soli TaxID=3144168 RepID=UPI0027E46752|nr:SIS domain-containing protein [Glaciibacter superstes]
MLKFNEEEFVSQLTSALGLRPEIEALVEEVHKRELKNLFLIGAGGTYATMMPYELLMRRNSSFPTRAVIAAELVLSGDATFGPQSLAVFASASGTTEDVLKAIEYSKAQGAYTVALTGAGDSPIARAVDRVLLTVPETWFDLQLLLLTTRLMSSRGEFAGYEKLVGELATIPQALVHVAMQADPAAAEFARAHKDSDYIFVVGAGNLWGFAYLYSMCVLEECQWLRTTRVHGAEFFHGSLELIEKDTTVLLFVGEDETRPLMERVQRFAQNYSDDVTTLDTAEFPLAEISPEFRGLLSPLIMDTVATRVSKHLEAERNHDLALRRYYRVVEY